MRIWLSVIACVSVLSLRAVVARAEAVPVCEGVVTAHDTIANQDTTAALDTFDWSAQSFVVPFDVNLTKVAIRIANVGVLTDSATVQIRTGGPGVTDPPGSTIVTSHSMVDADTNFHFANFVFAPGTVLTAGTPYYIVATATGGVANGYVWGSDASSPTYTLGQTFSSQFGTFMPFVSRPDVDMLFQVYGECTPPPSSTPTSSPTGTPTRTPTSTATGTPSQTPTETPTHTPSSTATVTPTQTVTATPSITPTSTPSATPTRGPGEGGQSGDTCSDGIDNDGDRLIDCADFECQGDAACPAEAPAMQPTTLAFAIFVLLAIGAFQLLRVRHT